MKLSKKLSIGILAAVISVSSVISIGAVSRSGSQTKETKNGGSITGDCSYSLSSTECSASASGSWNSSPSGKYSYDTFAEVSMGYSGGGYSFDNDEHVNAESKASLSGSGSVTQTASCWVGATVDDTGYEVFYLSYMPSRSID